jgi:hypothetical protein
MSIVYMTLAGSQSAIHLSGRRRSGHLDRAPSLCHNLVRSSRYHDGTRSVEGPGDLGRTLFFPCRNGPARPSAAAGRSRPPGHSGSRPFVWGQADSHGTPSNLRNASTSLCFVSDLQGRAFYSARVPQPFSPSSSVECAQRRQHQQQ